MMNYTAAFVFLTGVFCTSQVNSPLSWSNPDTFNSAPVVLIELFTSQGCSSCPSADQLLNEVIQSSEKKGDPVIGLSYHVSYWNYLGWKDPYSSEEYTSRQKKYASALQLSNIYTPQIIVNGSTEFVGSDSDKLSASITDALAENPRYEMEATASLQRRTLVINYAIDKEPKNELLNVAIVESYVQNDVPRGENKGLKLKHHNVVRKLEVRKLLRSAAVEVNLPDGQEFTGGTSVVLYAQDPTSMKVLGARRILLNAKINGTRADGG